MIEQKDTAGAVPFEDAVGDEPGWGSFAENFVVRFSERECFCLGEDVGHQQVVMSTDGVQGISESDEVTWDESGALVDQLVERVLSVGAWFPPVDGTGIVVDNRAIESNAFAVAFHGELLEVGGEAFEVLIVWQNGLCVCLEEIHIPHP